MVATMIAMMLAGSAPPDAALGRWKTEARNGIVEISRCGESICGRLISSDGLRANPGMKDINNKDAALRQRPLKNLQLIGGGFEFHDGAWTGGTIYNAEDGKTYMARLKPEGADRLKVRGCIFVPLCKTQTWTRVR